MGRSELMVHEDIHRIMGIIEDHFGHILRVVSNTTAATAKLLTFDAFVNPYQVFMLVHYWRSEVIFRAQASSSTIRTSCPSCAKIRP
jgi:hypothetical protein